MRDSESGEIVGFSEEGTVDCTDVPDALKEMMGNQQFTAEESNDVEARNSMRKVKSAGNVVVSPLIWVKWGQGKYYNNLCPADSKGQGGHAQVGCGALVMGSVMRYWRYPTTGNGSRSYNCNYSSYGYGDYGTLSADFGSTTYDYSNMPKKLTSSSTDTQKKAVATLLYHCGVAVNMVYGPTASTSHSDNIVSALSQYFRFPATVEYIEKSYYTTTEWHEILQGELDEGAPFFYGASGSYGGHVFVCDGYRDDNYYHIVWGWNGSYDGWFKIGSFNPGPYDFNNNHAAIIGIRGPQVPASDEGPRTKDEDALVRVNPVIGVLMLNGEHSGEIYDMTGRCVMRFEGESVDISGLTSGAYVVKSDNKREIVIVY